MVSNYFQRLAGLLIQACCRMLVFTGAAQVTFMSTSLDGKPRVQSRFRDKITRTHILFIKADGNINMYITESQNSTFFEVEIHSHINMSVCGSLQASGKRLASQICFYVVDSTINALTGISSSS